MQHLLRSPRLRRHLASAHRASFSKAVEDRYVKLNHLDHVLLRPQMYIGSVEEEQRPMWALERRGRGRVVSKNVSFVPGLLKIFDEVLVNAVDNRQRDKKMRRLEVSLDDGSSSGTPSAAMCVGIVPSSSILSAAFPYS